jgi:hypothetical protein
MYYICYMTYPRWLLLTHQLPAEPSNVRVKVWRKLQALGSVPIKNSIYVLPNLPGTKEDFEWLRKEIIQMKGDASVFLADSVTDIDDREIVVAFQKARAKEYERFMEEAAALVSALKAAIQGGQIKDDALERLERRWTSQKMDWERLLKVDFFKNSNRAKSEILMTTIQKIFQEAKTLSLQASPKPPSLVDVKTLKGKVWVTRTSLHIDRLACAWLIRHFIDPKARFKFVAEPYNPKSSELRFDMAEGEFTHFGDWCSFETFLHRLSMKEPVLREMAEIIHDIDLKDRKFGRLEASGVSQMVKGLCKLHSHDSKRLEAGIAFFDALHASLDQGGKK